MDDDDMVIGSADLDQCLAKGLLHRAVAVVVKRSDGRLVMQRRSLKDRWHPGLWTLSSTGHVRQGESYDDAARRELMEELGISAPLRRVSKLKLSPISDGKLIEHEWVSIFEASSDDSLVVDPTELESASEFSLDQIQNLETTGSLTPDSVELLESYRSGN